MESIHPLLSCLTFENVRIHIIYVIVFLLSAVLIHYSTQYLKHTIKIMVECWFCLQKCPVIYSNRNSWHCKYCTQYNGFNNDGSYNKSLDEHFQDNRDVYYCKRVPLIKYEQHRLCEKCNKNEEIKIKMLADFIPLDERHFDKEIADFKKHLDSLYQICEECQLLISKLIDKPRIERIGSPLSQNLNCGQNEKQEISRYFSYDTKRSLITFWVFISDLFILASLFFLYCQSFHAFLFKHYAKDFLFLRFFPIEDIKIYLHYYFSVVMSGFIFFLVSTYLNYNPNLSIDFPLLLLWISLILNHFSCNIFSLNHDQLVQWQQYLLVFQMLFTTGHLIYTLFGYIFLFKKTNSIEEYSRNVRESSRKNDKKIFHFEQLVDQTNDVRKQIKQLSLTDDSNLFDSTNIDSLFNDDSFIDTNHSRKQATISSFRLFSPTTTEVTVNSMPQIQFPKQTKQHQQPQYKFSCVYNFPNANVFPNIISTNSFLENTQLISNEFTSNYHYNEMQSCSHSNNPRVLNYFTDNDLTNRFNSSSPTVVSGNLSSKQFFYSNMLYSFVLILFLIILLSIVVILSLPISMNYNSSGGSFTFKIIVNNSQLAEI